MPGLEQRLPTCAGRPYAPRICVLFFCSSENINVTVPMDTCVVSLVLPQISRGQPPVSSGVSNKPSWFEGNLDEAPAMLLDQAIRSQDRHAMTGGRLPTCKSSRGDTRTESKEIIPRLHVVVCSKLGTLWGLFGATVFCQVQVMMLLPRTYSKARKCVCGKREWCLVEMDRSE